MKKVATSILAVMVVGLISAGAQTSYAAMTPVYTTKVFDLKDRTKQVLEFKNEFEVVGDKKTMVTTFFDKEGKLLAVETTVVKLEADGSESLLSFEQDQKQFGTLGKIEVKEGKANFTHTADGKTKTSTETIEPNFVVAAMVMGLLRRNWEKLMKGETIKVRYGVVDRRESVGFSFMKESATAEKVVIKMKATSMIIAALVSPLRFNLQPDGKKMLELEGRIAVKVNQDGKFKDFDGYTVYTYASAPEAAPSAPANKK